MDGICRILDCYYGTCPADDTEQEWMAIRVAKDGNVHYLSGPCPTREEAEAIAAEEHRMDLEQNGQSGVGA